MSECTVKVRGLSELEQRLRDEPKKVAVKVVRAAGKKGGQIWQDEIEERAPRESGYGSEHIAVATKAVGGDEGHLQVIVGPEKSAFYLSFSEFGTIHQPARPFVRPAYEARKEDVLDTFVEELGNRLDDLKEK